jgi:hypothetical protein
MFKINVIIDGVNSTYQCSQHFLTFSKEVQNQCSQHFILFEKIQNQCRQQARPNRISM